MSIYLPQYEGQVIMIDGVCYEARAQDTHAPTHTTEEITRLFGSCEACLAWEPSEVSSEVPEISSEIPEESSWVCICDEDTVLLLHCDGADAATVFPDDACGGNAPHTVTAHNAAQVDTAQKKFGTGSLENERGTGDYLSIPTDSDFDWRSGDWTMECWIRPESTDQNQGFLTIGSGDFQCIMLYWNESGDSALTGIVSTSGVGWINVKGGAITPGNWYHTALVRDGNTLRLFLEGTQVDTDNVVGNILLNNYSVKIGIFYNLDPGGCYDGWLDEVRFSKGIARYTANFTPPTEPFSECIN